MIMLAQYDLVNFNATRCANHETFLVKKSLTDGANMVLCSMEKICHVWHGVSRKNVGNVAKGNARQESVLRFGAGSTFSCANCDAYRSNLRKDRNRNNFRNIFQHPVTRFARQPGVGYVLNNLLKLRLGQLKCACPSRTASALSPLLIISTNFLCSS